MPFSNDVPEISLTENSKLSRQISDEIKRRTKDNKIPENINKHLLLIANNETEDETKLNSLSVLAFYFSNEYASSHDPTVREFTSRVIGEYVKKHYPTKYNETIYNFVCADPVCGKDLDDNINIVLNIIDQSELEDNIKITIKENLVNAGYMPESENDHALFGFSLVYGQLLETGNTEASRAARIILDNYLKDNPIYD